MLNNSNQLFILTANRLLDGQVVFFQNAGHWVESIQYATVYADSEALAQAEAIAGQAQSDGDIIALATIEVSKENGALIPVAIRELIRVQGPTIDYGAITVEPLRLSA